MGRDGDRERSRDREWDRGKDRGARGRSRSRSPHRRERRDSRERRDPPRLDEFGREIRDDRGRNDHRGRDRDRGGGGHRDSNPHPREEAEEFLDSVVEPAEERPKKKSKTAATAPEETPAEMNAAETNDADGPPVDPEEAEMMALMGFGGFGSTAGKHVDDPNANVGAVRKKTTRKARQYMNRPGGFNRPLPEEKTGIKQNKI